VWFQKPCLAIWRAICSQGVQGCVETVIRHVTPCTLKQYLRHSDLFRLTAGCDLRSVVGGVTADVSKDRSAVICELPPVMCLAPLINRCVSSQTFCVLHARRRFVCCMREDIITVRVICV
jgi:hypothetical protein